MDIKGLKMTILLAEPFKSEVLARQTLGRTRDPNTIYLEFVDEGFAATKRYYQTKLPIFGKYATGCKEIRFDDINLASKAIDIKREHDSLICPFTMLDDNGEPILAEAFNRYGK